MDPKEHLGKRFVKRPIGDAGRAPSVEAIVKAVNSLLAGVGEHRIRYVAKTIADRDGFELRLVEVDIG